jgi:hypothetical protein
MGEKNRVFPKTNLKLTQRQYLRSGSEFPAYLTSNLEIYDVNNKPFIPT